MQEREITSRIRIDELQGLLDTQEPPTQQRTTAPMPAVTLEMLLQPEEPPAPIQITFRRPPRGTDNLKTAGVGAADDFENDAVSGDYEAYASDDGDDRDDGEDRDSRETARVTIRNTVRMAAAEAAGVLGTVNGIPVQVAGFDSSIIAAGSNPAIRPPSAIDAAIDAAVDAAIDAEIHNAEIDAAIDAVVLPAVAMPRQRFGMVALSFALSFVAGIVIMFLLS